jgi:protein O-GlcNAc transferase
MEPLFTSIEEEKKSFAEDDLKILNDFLKQAHECEKTGLISKGNAIYREALHKYPRSWVIYSNLAENLKRQGRVREALLCCDRSLRLLPQNDVLQNSRLFLLHYHDQFTAEDIFNGIKDYTKQQLAKTQMFPKHLLAPVRGRKKVRIVFASPDLRRHSVAHFVQPIVQGLDKERYESYAYYYSDAKTDNYSELIKKECAEWREFKPRDFNAIADAALQDRPDILVDLSGHCQNNILPILAARIAPIQVTMLGYPNTTGTPNVDFRIVDEFSDPIGMTEKFNTEKLIRTQGSAWCFSSQCEVESTFELPCERRNIIVYGSFNFLPKITDTMLRVWGRILNAVPNSRLLIKSLALSDPESCDLFRRRLIALDCPFERVEYLGFVDHANHLRMYNEVDIALDTYPYQGTTTTCEALWMGVPVISLIGEMHVARVSASLLHHAQLDELLARTPDEYVEKAVALANDRERLRKYKKETRANMRNSPLGNAQLYAKNITKCFEKMLRLKKHPLATH